MPVLYDLAIGAYHLSIRCAAPFSTKARKWVQGRRGSFDRLEQRSADLKACCWMHCASLGEFEQGRPVLEAIKEQRPEMPILLTFYSPSGYLACKDLELADHVEYLPMDGARNAKRFLDLVDPALAIYVKYDLWYHHLHGLRSRGIPTYLISAIFRSGQPFFQFWGNTHRGMLRCFDHLFVQDERSVDLLRNISIANATVAGDTRFDRVVAIAEQAKEIPLGKAFKRASELPILVCGSTWPADERVLANVTSELPPLRMLIAPHEVDNEHVEQVLELMPRPADKWSHLHGLLKGLFNPPDSGYPQLPDQPNGDPLELRTLVVDRIGLLSRLYRYGDIAYVGGGLGSGIHNLLEAAVWGIPVIFGPKHQKFAEAQGLIDVGGGFSVKNELELTEVLGKLLHDKTARKTAGEAAQAFVMSKRGATHRIIAKLLWSVRS